MSAKTLAVSALVDRLRALLPDMRARAMVGDRTDLFEDNLLSGLAPWQAAVLRAQLEQGDGGELQVSPAGQLPDAHAPHSSATLAFNAFGRWLGSEEDLRLSGIGGFDTMRIEARVAIFPAGRAPNLDVLATGPGVAAGVESKLTEPLAGHPRRRGARLTPEKSAAPCSPVVGERPSTRRSQATTPRAFWTSISY